MILTHKDYKCGDENEILMLFQKSFNRIMDISFWKWRYKENILNKYMIRIAKDGDNVVAHYAVSPTELFINGKLFNSAISMTTMTHPNYRGLGLFTKLASELLESHSEDLDVIYGVPNNNSINGFVNHLDFKHISDIIVMEIDLRKTTFKLANQCLEIKKFDFRFDELLDKIKYKYTVMLSRCSKYLNWRFCNNPVNKYTILTYQSNGELLGYAVIKVFVNESVLVGDIVDIIAVDTNVFCKLIESVCCKFYEKGITSAKIWMNDNEFIKALRNIGFIQTDETFHFIVKSNNKKVPNEIQDFNNWYLTMSDIDIF
ncbi:MAG: GNAT family N-acetyltransferase [Clostridium sulfidigenes]|uniref:GNAT family N-acetyltransferase n=1 Tax=Clostridium sulfidigenes TaxID=318464 RepID=A0A927W3F5_9CLOT|nr:GNAT family N-acetyltransferase [Clostridium sulfidigenes]